MEHPGTVIGLLAAMAAAGAVTLLSVVPRAAACNCNLSLAASSHPDALPAPLASSASSAPGGSTEPSRPPLAAAIASAKSPAGVPVVGSTVAPPGAPAGSVVAPPAPPKRGTLSGDITTTPAQAAKNAVVYLEDGPLDRVVDGTMDNRGMAFAPHVVPITVNGKLTVTNSDPFPHNAFSNDNEKWDFGVLASKGVKSRRFEKPGVYTVLCNMHPNMKGYVIVLPSSHFAKADAKGHFSLPDVPQGTYRVTAWAPGTKPSTQSLTIGAEEATADFDLHR